MKFSESAEWRLKSHVCRLESKTILGGGGVTHGTASTWVWNWDKEAHNSLKKRTSFVSMKSSTTFYKYDYNYLGTVELFPDQ